MMMMMMTYDKHDFTNEPFLVLLLTYFPAMRTGQGDPKHAALIVSVTVMAVITEGFGSTVGWVVLHI